tara:strand:+ start:1020 stop:2051 length:1032 start_codon:yes stop_codon:yes gene_type:complete
MEKMKLSIIVCAYNEQDSIKKCIEELLDQVINHHNIEIIIIDNESKDQTYDIASDCIKNSLFKNIRLFSIEHCPLTGSRNFGLNAARGEYIAYVDADGYIMDNWLTKLIENIQNDFDIILGSVSINSSSSFFSKGIFYSHFLPSLESSKNKIIGANMAFKRSKLLSVKGFHTVPTGRGDEILVFSLLKEKFKSLKIIYDKSCKVVNSYPHKVSIWLNQQIDEGRSGRRIDDSIYKRIIKSIFKLPSFILPIIVLLDFFSNISFNIYLILLQLLFIRHLFRFQYYSNSIQTGFNNLGIQYILFFPILILGSIFLDVGYFFGLFDQRERNYIISNPGKLLKKYPN